MAGLPEGIHPKRGRSRLLPSKRLEDGRAQASYSRCKGIYPRIRITMLRLGPAYRWTEQSEHCINLCYMLAAIHAKVSTYSHARIRYAFTHTPSHRNATLLDTTSTHIHTKKLDFSPWAGVLERYFTYLLGAERLGCACLLYHELHVPGMMITMGSCWIGEGLCLVVFA